MLKCPECNVDYCGEMVYVGVPVKIQCQNCGYYAERKEFEVDENVYLKRLAEYREWFDKQ